MEDVVRELTSLDAVCSDEFVLVVAEVRLCPLVVSVDCHGTRTVDNSGFELIIVLRSFWRMAKEEFNAWLSDSTMPALALNLIR